jgi:hypothetical protein
MLAMSGEPSIADLRAQSEHAALRLALYRRRVYLGRADGTRLAEHQRIAHGAAERLRRAELRSGAQIRGGSHEQ